MCECLVNGCDHECGPGSKLPGALLRVVVYGCLGRCDIWRPLGRWGVGTSALEDGGHLVCPVSRVGVCVVLTVIAAFCGVGPFGSPFLCCSALGMG